MAANMFLSGLNTVIAFFAEEEAPKPAPWYKKYLPEAKFSSLLSEAIVVALIPFFINMSHVLLCFQFKDKLLELARNMKSTGQKKPTKHAAIKFALRNMLSYMSRSTQIGSAVLVFGMVDLIISGLMSDAPLFFKWPGRILDNTAAFFIALPQMSFDKPNMVVKVSMFFSTALLLSICGSIGLIPTPPSDPVQKAKTSWQTQWREISRCYVKLSIASAYIGVFLVTVGYGQYMTCDPVNSIARHDRFRFLRTSPLFFITGSGYQQLHEHPTKDWITAMIANRPIQAMYLLQSVSTRGIVPFLLFWTIIFGAGFLMLAVVFLGCTVFVYAPVLYNEVMARATQMVHEAALEYERPSKSDEVASGSSPLKQTKLSWSSDSKGCPKPSPTPVYQEVTTATVPMTPSPRPQTPQGTREGKLPATDAVETARNWYCQGLNAEVLKDFEAEKARYRKSFIPRSPRPRLPNFMVDPREVRSSSTWCLDTEPKFDADRMELTFTKRMAKQSTSISNTSKKPANFEKHEPSVEASSSTSSSTKTPTTTPAHQPVATSTSTCSREELLAYRENLARLERENDEGWRRARQAHDTFLSNPYITSHVPDFRRLKKGKGRAPATMSWTSTPAYPSGPSSWGEKPPVEPYFDPYYSPSYYSHGPAYHEFSNRKSPASMPTTSPRAYSTGPSWQGSTRAVPFSSFSSSSYPHTLNYPSTPSLPAYQGAPRKGPGRAPASFFKAKTSTPAIRSRSSLAEQRTGRPLPSSAYYDFRSRDMRSGAWIAMPGPLEGHCEPLRPPHLFPMSKASGAHVHASVAAIGTARSGPQSAYPSPPPTSPTQQPSFPQDSVLLTQQQQEERSAEVQPSSETLPTRLFSEADVETLCPAALSTPQAEEDWEFVEAVEPVESSSVASRAQPSVVDDEADEELVIVL